MNIKKDERGFAIITIVFGILILFMLLIVSLLEMLSSYKKNMSLLIDNNNGGRDSVTVKANRDYASLDDLKSIADSEKKSGLYCFGDVCQYYAKSDLIVVHNGPETVFDINSASRSYEVEKGGLYYIKACGGDGSSSTDGSLPGGRGVCTSGYIYLEGGETFHTFIGVGGGQEVSNVGLYNYGSTGSSSSSGTGGGATNVMLGGYYSAQGDEITYVENGEKKIYRAPQTTYLPDVGTYRIDIFGKNLTKCDFKASEANHTNNNGERITQSYVLHLVSNRYKTDDHYVYYTSISNDNKPNGDGFVLTAEQDIEDLNSGDPTCQVNKMEFYHIENSIMVAAGGGAGGTVGSYAYIGGNGGGLIGGYSKNASNGNLHDTPGSQKVVTVTDANTMINTRTNFMVAVDNENSIGSGGGYYCSMGGAGGSSYISGFAGVNSVKEKISARIENNYLTGTNTLIYAPDPDTDLTNDTLHFSRKYFINGMVTEKASEDANGSVLIQYIQSTPLERLNVPLQRVRYVRNCIADYTYLNKAGAEKSDKINIRRFNDIQVIREGVNFAKGRSISVFKINNGTISSINESSSGRAVDGIVTYSGNANTVYSHDFTNNNYYNDTLCITVDLNEVIDNIDEIAAIHAGILSDNTIHEKWYYKTDYIEVSENGSTWYRYDFSDKGYETSNGRRINAFTSATYTEVNQ